MSDLLDHLRSEVEPRVDGWEEAGHVPPEALWEVGRRFGLLGMMTPAERGGAPRPWTEITEIATDLGRIYRPFGFLLTNALIAGYLAAVADDGQWRRLGLPIVEGRAASVLALNEPDSGNDLAALSTLPSRVRRGLYSPASRPTFPTQTRSIFCWWPPARRPNRRLPSLRSIPARRDARYDGWGPPWRYGGFTCARSSSTGVWCPPMTGWGRSRVCGRIWAKAACSPPAWLWA